MASDSTAQPARARVRKRVSAAHPQLTSGAQEEEKRKKKNTTKRSGSKRKEGPHGTRQSDNLPSDPTTLATRNVDRMGNGRDADHDTNETKTTHKSDGDIHDERVSIMSKMCSTDMNLQFVDLDIGGYDTSQSDCDEETRRLRRGLAYMNAMAMGEVAEFKSFSEMRGRIDARAQLLVDRSASRPVGYFTYTQNEEAACLGQIFVIPSARKRGFAALMLSRFTHDMFREKQILQIEQPNECLCRLLHRMKLAHRIEVDIHFTKTHSLRKRRRLALERAAAQDPYAQSDPERLSGSAVFFTGKPVPYIVPQEQSDDIVNSSNDDNEVEDEEEKAVCCSSPKRRRAIVHDHAVIYVPTGNMRFMAGYT